MSFKGRSINFFDRLFQKKPKEKNKDKSQQQQQTSVIGNKVLESKSNNSERINNPSSSRNSKMSSSSLTHMSDKSNQDLPCFLKYSNPEPINNSNNIKFNSNFFESEATKGLNLSPIKEEDKYLRGSGNSKKHNKDDNRTTSDLSHKLQLTSFAAPTYCDYCSQLLIGLIKQGLRCESCGQNFHKQCIAQLPNICNKNLVNKIMMEDQTHGFNFNTHEKNLRPIEIEHTFLKTQIQNTNHMVLTCAHCKNKINSSEKFLHNCKDCHIIVHMKCIKNVEKNCRPQTENNPLINITDGDGNLVSMTSITSENEPMNLDETQSELLKSSNNLNVIDMKLEDENTINNNINATGPYKKNANISKKANQICLQRLSQRVKKTSGIFWSGHMVYYTKDMPKFTTHYWKLDSKSITIYDSYKLERLLQEIPLETIKKANLCGLNGNSKEDCINDQKCLFILKSDIDVYYCGMGNTDPNVTMNVLARNFYNLFKMVYLPYSSRNGGSRMSLKITAPKYEERNLEDEYVINPQELLGSGQFGQVYGGICKATGEPVAIKVIDKTRFNESHAETSVFQNEITILYNLKHPGIVKLLALYDGVDHLNIVTEKMATDMLEMILNKKPDARLSERIAKFVIYQILIALGKLHDRNIAHCDLKPENILLTENVEFPQVKICDFGYAKIIGENSFRRSMVGTPAYSPPELKQKRVYNNSIDMWSMGVIVYVSLSGTFPFEEDKDIYEQIMNLDFMYPSDPWDSISSVAIDLINKFLQVKMDRRMSASRALQHAWFSKDLDLYSDLMALENRLGQKWLIPKEQEEKWIKQLSEAESSHL